MYPKPDNPIVFPLDVPSAAKALSWVRMLGPHVGMFKVGLELFIQEGPGIISRIREAAPAGIFLDLKLHDIATTVNRAMARVASLGVDLVTVHCSSSPEMLVQAVDGGQGKTGVLGVTLLTDNDGRTLEQAGYQQRFADNPSALVRHRALMARDAGCRGVVCSGREAREVKAACGSGFLVVTPGIRPEWHLTRADDQKRITTPAQAMAAGSDLLVIGRPIRDAPDPVEAARQVIREIQAAQEATRYGQLS